MTADGQRPPGPPGEDASPLQHAQWLDSVGYRVLPASGKSPAMDKWRQFQDRSTTTLLPSWFGGPNANRRNFWVMCGPASGRVALDVDNEATLEHFRQHPTIGPTLDTTCCVKTSHGWHFHYTIAEGEVVEQASSTTDDASRGLKWDFRAANKGGVLVPPSTHPDDGSTYEWVRGPEHAVSWPGWGAQGAVGAPTTLHQRRRRSGSSPTSGAGVGATGPQAAPQATPGPYDAFGGPGSRRSQLAALIRKMPAMHEHDGRNNVFTAVLGHLAKHIPYQDAFEGLAGALNQHFGTPLDEQEWRRCSGSVWEAEQESISSVRFRNEAGMLASEGEQLWTPTKVKQGDAHVEIPKPWGDFDLRLRGIIDTPDGGVQYVVDVIKAGRATRAQLDRRGLGEWRVLQTWLAHYQATVAPPPNDSARNVPHNVRLHRYLMDQPAERYKAARALGWESEACEGGGFLCHEGVITSRGLQAMGKVVPDPRLVGWAPYRYGFEHGDGEAIRVLREVMTFHDGTVTAVFGAWWIACLLKPQITKHTALFPFMALEAPSESGKTTGFFNLMLQLAGNYEGHGEYTMPVLRDRASAHRSGIVWVDDISDPTGVLDLLRQATSGGVRAKKAADRTANETVELVAPVVLSGEGLGSLGMEKALLDRAVRLEVPNPTQRRSLRDPERMQWDDIVALREQYSGDLTQLAGSVVQSVLRLADRTTELPRLRQGGGRRSDVFAILLTGATILAELLDDTGIIGRVERWIAAQEGPSDENYLTRFMLPYLLRKYNVPRTAQGALSGMPVFVDNDGVVWFSEVRCADEWRQIARTPRERQLGSADSIRSQRKALGIDGNGTRKQIGKYSSGNARVSRYQRLPDGISAKVVERTADDLEPGHRGVDSGVSNDTLSI